MLPVRIQRALTSVLVKSDLPGNIVLVRVKFSLKQILRVEMGIARSDSKANLMK